MAGKLAIDGGKRVWNRGFPAWPQFDRRTDQKVLDILHTGKVNYWGGHVGMDFETAWAKWLGVKNAVAVSNGAAALHVALAALGIGTGDEVVCTGGSDLRSHTGTRMVFAVERVEAAITRRTKALVVSHQCGIVADLGPILKLAKKHGLFVVEDCSQCVGGVYRGKKTGALGTVSFFSFGPSCHFSAGGEGGMVCCNDDALAWEMRSIRDHGYDAKVKLDLLRTEGKQAYIHRRVGYNFRMTEIQAAVGLGELRRFDTWNLPRRRRLGQALVRGLMGHPLVKRAPVDTKARRNSFLLAPFVLDATKLNLPVRDFIAAVQTEGANACPLPQDDATIAFWTHPTYTLAHIRADVRAFEKVAAAMMK